MPPKIALMTDSCCDLPTTLTQRYGITVLPLSLNTSLPEPTGNRSVDELNVNGFYQQLQTGLQVFTSAVSSQAFVQAMRPLLAAGTDILYIGFSSALSATYVNACVAAQQMIRRFPRRQIYCVDSKGASMGQGLLVYLTALQIKQGMGIWEAACYAEQMAPKICHWFTVENLKLLKQGGRINATVSPGGSMLHMKPLLHVDDQGRLVHIQKFRGRQATMDAMLERLRTDAVDIKHQIVMISHGNCHSDAMYLENRIFHELHPAEILMNTVSPVIAAHSGPRTLALFFVGEKR